MDFMELLDFDCMGTGVPKEINVAVWVGDISLIFSALAHMWDATPMGVLPHTSSLGGSDPLLACALEI